MPLFVDPNRTMRYVPKAEREKPEADQVAFRLRALTAREFAEFQDRATAPDDGGRMRRRIFVFDVELLRLALVGWEGPGVPTWPEGGAEAALDLLDPKLRDELSLAAWDLNILTEDQAGN